jgi:hypothetical protein
MNDNVQIARRAARAVFGRRVFHAIVALCNLAALIFLVFAIRGQASWSTFGVFLLIALAGLIVAGMAAGRLGSIPWGTWER